MTAGGPLRPAARTASKLWWSSVGPATARHRRSEAMAARASARVSTVIPASSPPRSRHWYRQRRRHGDHSGRPDIASGVADGHVHAHLGRRSVTAEDLRSLPVTVCPGPGGRQRWHSCQPADADDVDGMGWAGHEGDGPSSLLMPRPPPRGRAWLSTTAAPAAAASGRPSDDAALPMASSFAGSSSIPSSVTAREEL